MKNKISQLIELVKKLPESSLDEAIEYITEKVEENTEKEPLPTCPHCQKEEVVKNGQKGGKQRYSCKNCGKSFGATTNTAMSWSHYGEAVWKQVIRDTVSGESLEKTAESLDIFHATAFNMRHKILLSLETQEAIKPTVLDGVCELDDTYVLESLKGSKIPEDYYRKPRKHGAVASKPGISNEYICISTGIERDGKAYSQSVTRATPTKDEIIDVFGNRMGEEAFVLCDGAASYTALGENCDCPVKNVSEDGSKHGKGFFNINTANSFHSFIKSRYNKYSGVATKYLNRYNALFSKVFRSDNDIEDELYTILKSNDSERHRTVNDVKTLDLLEI